MSSGHMQLMQRFWSLMISWLIVGVIYGSTRFVGSEQKIIPELWLDQQIAFNTKGIWLYLSFFLVVPFAFWKAPLQRISIMMWAIILSALISGLFFIALPSTLNYPQAGSESISDKLFYYLLWIDTQQNCFPSLHASITIVCLLGLWQKLKTLQNSIYLVVTLAIGYSIIQLRRHLSLDVGAGVLVGIFSYFAASSIQHRLLLQRKN